MQWCIYCEKLVQPSRTYNWQWLALIIVSFVAVPIVLVLFAALPPLGGLLYLILCLFFILGLIGFICSLIKYIFFPAVVCPICRTEDIVKERPPDGKSGHEIYEERLEQDRKPWPKSLLWGIMGICLPFLAPVALIMGIKAFKKSGWVEPYTKTTILLGAVGSAELVALITTLSTADWTR
jgi:hypothetical protein